MIYAAQKMVRSPRVILWISLLLLAFAGCVAFAVMVVPWRQFVFAPGEVSVFNPMDRPQPIDAQIKGRLVELSVVEGQMVEKGDAIAILEDRDSKFLDPKRIQRIAEQIAALQEKQSATRQQLSALEGQGQAIDRALGAALPAAEAKARQAGQKTEVLRRQIRLANQDILTARLQRDRVETLFDQGLKSKRDLELAVQKLVEEETKLQKLEGDIDVVSTDIEIANLEQAKTAADLAEKQQKVAEGIAKARSVIAETEEKIKKLEGEASAIQVREELQKIVAPRNGQITKLKNVGPGHMIKEGDTLATLVPPQQSLGVELYVKGLDTPLVEVGRPVRIMFEGFPAVPFVGWPWASVGTFGGTVAVVDPTGAEEGKEGFRVWVLPDPNEPEWPPTSRLRIGSKVNGWILLDDVPLYYEIWRQLNAFPARPALQNESQKIKIKPVLRR